MNNNEILEMNKKEKELDEKLKYVNETVEQYKKQLREYKESHLEEFSNKDNEITDIHAIGSIKSLRIEKAKRDELQEEKDNLTKIREEEKKKVQEKLEYVEGTIEQYKKQLREYKESHPEEFSNKDNEITDIHAIGSLKALKIETEKQKQLQEKMKILNFDEQEISINKEEKSVDEEEKQSKDIKLNDKEESYTGEDIEALLNEGETSINETANQNLDNKPIEDEKIVKVGEGKSQIIFTEQELEDFVEDEEIIDLDNDQELSQIQKTARLLKPNNLSNDSVKIYYNAKKDIYMIENINEGTEESVNRKDLEKIDKKDLAEKLGKDIDNVDVNIYQLLLKYDEKYKTSKATEYIDMLSVQGKNKEQRQNDMKEHQIKIKYNLKGLYDKHEEELNEYEFDFSKEERKELLNVANNAKKKGIATVNKGVKTTLFETWEKITDKIFGKIKQLTVGKRITLPESKKEREERKERAKKREERLQKCENELVELEKVVEENEMIEKEFENAQGVTYSEKLASVGEKFRDSYKVSENQEEYKEYFEQSEKTRNEMKKKRYDEQYEWKDGNYTTVKDEENSL